jgi:hypothetical protein
LPSSQICVACFLMSKNVKKCQNLSKNVKICQNFCTLQIEQTYPPQMPYLRHFSRPIKFYALFNVLLIDFCF